MAFSRYKNDSRINLGQQIGTAVSLSVLRRAIKSGTIRISRQVIATGADRLDTLAGTIYGDAKYWWVLAAASNVGWGLQIPPGTVVNVIDLREVEKLAG